ncbi:MAG TPA: hypothetical protein VGO62_08355, partial [Myxococcota bacterium]
FVAAHAVNKLTGGLAPINEKPLSEPEARDAQAYDELNANRTEADAVAPAAAPAADEPAAS